VFPGTVGKVDGFSREREREIKGRQGERESERDREE